jgi:AcrR family transcriptional regulator
VTTDRRLVLAATALLDFGGEDAVTLRAVGHAAGISHNAPYKHFKSRDALLAAVATADFAMITEAFGAARQSSAAPAAKLMNALQVVIDFSVEHPARYRLLFSDPAIAAQKGELERTAFAAFGEFIGLVEECQVAQALPGVPNTTLAGLLFATMHGLIALKASGRMHPEKGLTGVRSSLELLIDLLSPRRKGTTSAKNIQRL